MHLVYYTTNVCALFFPSLSADGWAAYLTLTFIELNFDIIYTYDFGTGWRVEITFL